MKIIPVIIYLLFSFGCGSDYKQKEEKEYNVDFEYVGEYRLSDSIIGTKPYPFILVEDKTDLVEIINNPTKQYLHLEMLFQIRFLILRNLIMFYQGAEL